MMDDPGPPPSPSWKWAVTRFPHPNSRKGVMYLLPENRGPRNGRPPNMARGLNEPPITKDVPEDVKRAETGPQCLQCSKEHPVDKRHDKRP